MLPEDEVSLILQGKQLAILHQNYITEPQGLYSFEFKVFSQFGEDGIIEWLVEQLSPLPQIFIEFGVTNYTEANTKFLLINRNWRGLIIDNSIENINYIKKNYIYIFYDLTAAAHFVTRENINQIFMSHGFSGEIGILSIDVDGNDYWIWEKIDCVNPCIVICEYCAQFGDIHPISIPYQKHYSRFKGHYSGQYYSASLPAFIYLADMKGYTFIGTTKSGVNAFFVRKDLICRMKNKIPPIKSFPMLASDTRDKNGALTFIRGIKKLELIQDLTVINVKTSQESTIGSLGPLYSEEWQSILHGQYIG